jgi:hypothetical protein
MSESERMVEPPVAAGNDTDPSERGSSTMKTSRRIEPPSKQSPKRGKTEGGRIILISGPPGAGKSTVAAELVASSAGPTAYIEGDTFWHFIVKRGPSKEAPKSRMAASRMVIKAMMLAALPYARGGFETIVDFSVGPWFLGSFQSYIKDTPFDYVILCPSEGVCAARAASRAEGAMPDYSTYHGLHEAFDNIGEYEKYAIRNDEAGPAELAGMIREGCDLGTFNLDLTDSMLDTS